MEEWTKYVLDNVDNDRVLHYCAANLTKKMQYISKALSEEKNQAAAMVASDMANDIELLSALDAKMNGKKSTTVVA